MFIEYRSLLPDESKEYRRYFNEVPQFLNQY